MQGRRIRRVLPRTVVLILCVLFLFVSRTEPVKADIGAGNYDGVDWVLTDDGELIIGKTGETQTFADRANRSTGSWPWNNYKTSIKSVRFAGNVIGQGSLNSMFNTYENLESFNASGFDTSNVTNMGSMFYRCRGLTSLDLSGFNTSSVTNMYAMFSGCGNLASLDISGFNTSNVTSFGYMFYGCNNLAALDVSRFNTSNALYMDYMFDGCSSLTSLDVSGFDTSKVTGMRAMFYNCSGLTSLDVSGFRTPQVTTMQAMFYGCKKLTALDVSGFDTSNVTSMGSMFNGCNSLASLDTSGFNTSSVTDMGSMFNGCNSLASLNVSGFDVSNVTYMNQMFYDCRSLTSLDISRFDTSKATTMYQMFYGCRRLTAIDVSGFNTETVTNMSNMFNTCNAVTSLDLSNFNTSNVTNMAGMFAGCNALQSVNLGDAFSFKDTVLPTPPSTYEGKSYTGKWIREDKFYGPYTPIELRVNYTSAMAGTWVWESDYQENTVNFDANGGVLTGETSVTVQKTSPDVTLPDETQITRTHYTFTGWNTAADGTGTNYEAGSTYTVPMQADPVTLYAQWEPSPIRKYRVRHYQQSADLMTYALVETEVLEADYHNEVTVPVKNYEGFLLPAPVTVTISEDDTDEAMTVVEYRYDRAGYKIAYNRNGGDSGVMSDQLMTFGLSDALEKNTYSYTGHLFTGWNTMPDGTGEGFTDGQTVVDLAETNGATVTLYAQWLGNENGVSVENGQVTVQLKAGETIVIPDLPAGTRYRIEEIDLPSGWTMQETEDGQGIIIANGTSSSTVTNRYSASGQIELEAYKTLEGDTLLPGQFTFELVDSNGRVVSTAANETPSDDMSIAGNPAPPNTAHITFNSLFFTQDDIGQTYTYTIRESAPADPVIVPDTHEETVTVSIEDAGGGMLSVTAVYDGDGAHFTNSLKTTSLKVIKELEGVADYLKDTEFAFTVTLKDAQGNALIGSYPAVVTKKDGSEEEKTVMSGDSILLKGGETALITGLPIGASYSITEEERLNWHLEESQGTAGKLGLEEAQASFRNSYGGTLIGSAVLEADKVFTNGSLEEESFVLILEDETGNEISRAETDSSGHVRFAELTYELKDLGTHTYLIREAGDTTKGYIFFDTHEETVTVTVKDEQEAQLVTEIAYDADGAVFTNTYERSLEFKKLDETGEGLPGAKMRMTGTADLSGVSVTGADDIVIAADGISFTTNGNTVSFTGLPYGTFVISETEPPVGYAAAADAVISDPDIRSVEMTDPYLPHEITVSKKDVAGDELAGARLTLSGRAYGAETDIEPVTWTSSSDGPHTIFVKPGTYTLHEESVPSASYLAASDITFTIDAQGTVKVGQETVQGITMTDDYAPHTVYISKIDMNNALLPGASLKITGTDAAGDAIEPIALTSAGEAQTVSLKPGEYVLTETNAPEGFLPADPISFKVDKNGGVSVLKDDGYVSVSNAQVVMQDQCETHSLEIAKRVTGSLGDKTAEFHFELSLEGAYVGTAVAYEKDGTEGTSTLTNGKATFTLAHGETITFKEIPHGTAYAIRELDGESREYEVTYTDASGTLTRNASASIRNNKGGWVPTDATGSDMMAFGALGAGAAAFVIWYRKRRREEQAPERP